MFYSMMMSGAQGTVSATNGAAGEVSAALIELELAFARAGSDLDHSPVVANALAAVLMGAISPGSDSVNSRINVATSSTSTALGHYSQGDQQMSANVFEVPSNLDIPGVR